MNNSFTLNGNTLDRDLDSVTERLTKTKTSQKEILRTRLILEEAYLRIKESRKDNFTATVNVHQRFDAVSLQMIYDGEEFDPLMAESSAENEEDTYRYTVLNAYKIHIGYQKKNGRNIFTVSAHEAGSHTIRDTFLFMVAGILVGLLIRNFFPADHITNLRDELIVPLRTIFLTLLQMMVAPVVFFSILSGIISMSDKSSLGKRGAKLIIISLIMIFCLTAILITAALMIFRTGNPAIRELLKQEMTEGSGTSFSFMDMLVGIIPKDIVDPFTGSDILQTLFMAVFLGVIINHWPQGAKIIDTVQFLNKFFMRVLSVIVKLVPGFVFISMINMTIGTGVDSFIALGELVLANVVGLILVWIFAGLVVMIVAHVSPLKYLKKLIGYSVIPFSLSSSNAAIPFTLDFCNDELGIDSKLSMFSIPIGIQFNKAGACTFLAMSSVMVVRAYGMPITPDFIAKLFFAIFIMSMAKPSVPAAGIVCLSSVFQAIGVAPDAVEIVLCITPILNMFNTAAGASTNVTSTTILASMENCIDKTVFNK